MQDTLYPVESNRTISRTQWRRSLVLVVVFFLLGCALGYYRYGQEAVAEASFLPLRLDELVEVLPKSPRAVGRAGQTHESHEVKHSTTYVAAARGGDMRTSNQFPAKQKQKSSLALKPQRFDPNAVTREELLAMGLKEYMVSGFLKHREAKLRKGYVFSSVEDFRSNREIPKEIDDILASYIHIQPRLHAFDPNTVTSGTLMGFGIGISEKRAAAFLRYREVLQSKGKGFRTVDDFKRVRVITAKQDSILQGYVRLGE